MEMRLKPLRDQVVVKCEPLQDETRNGIIILKHQQRIRAGEVLAVGVGHRNWKNGKTVPLAVKVGDRVAFFRENMETLHGKQLKDSIFELSEEHGADIAVLPESSLFGVIEKDTVVDA
jgi:co-chaperonin GroES (HSP10)